MYKGLAIGTVDAQDYIYATNFYAGDVEMYNSSFQLVKTFTDRTMPKGYAPYNIQTLNGTLYVTYAKQDKAKHDSVSGAGFGYVDAFSLKGKFMRRVISQGALNAPWGLDIAPSGFGAFAGDLLVGNFGDGWINAYDPKKGKYMGPLVDSTRRPHRDRRSMGLITGNGGQGGDANTVYFTAGLKKEGHGLFGGIRADPRRLTPGRLIRSSKDHLRPDRTVRMEISFSRVLFRSKSDGVELLCGGWE